MEVENVTSANPSEPSSAAGIKQKTNKALAMFEAKSQQESSISSRAPPASKMDRIQHWVNDISEESTTRASPETESEVGSTSGPPKKSSGPPKVKKKYTTSGRRTSSMSGMDIKQKSVDLKKLPQPADLRVPISGNKKKLKTAEKIISQEEIKEENEEWTLVKLQNGIESDSSSYEIVDAAEELEQVLLFIIRIFILKLNLKLTLMEKMVY
jgi:hypothetical protein